MVDVKDILNKHAGRIEAQMGSFENDSGFSQSYQIFKSEMAPSLSRYERWCKSLGSLIQLKTSKKDEEKIGKYLKIAHLDIEPWQALTLSVMTFVSIFLIGLLISVAVVLIKGSINSFPLLFFFIFVVLAMFLFYFVGGYPERLATKWRLKASSQMVPAILYIVVYMRHTPNLEKAIEFASRHLEYPLALDFKKIFYDVEVGKFSTIKESLDNYLESWRDYSVEFIEAFHLIQSSLFEPDDTRRVSTLEKAIQVILDGIYDKMLKFTHDVRSPLTNVYMLGVVLPTLALALLPLASAMIGGVIKSFHIFLLFNILVPFLVFYLTNKVLLLRPGGYGETSLLERNPLYYKYKDKKPYVIAFLLFFPFLIIGLLPFIFQYTPLPGWIGLQKDYTFEEVGLGFLGNGYLFDFKSSGTGFVGPFGIVAVVLGMLITLGITLFFWFVYKRKTRELIIERESTRQLETEFNNSLFQIGNRLGNGVPSELVFAKIVEASKGLVTEDFFRRVNYNIQQMGMSVESAIFDVRRGALIYYPSQLIATSMRVLVESSRKGLKIAALSLMSISEYIKNIQKITARLRDLLAEIISDMKSNMTFLAPLLSGIVVGLAVMITSILDKIQLPSAAETTQSAVGFSSLESLVHIFELTKMIPPYFVQVSIGIYLIEIIFILTSALVTIESGEDRLERTFRTGKNLFIGSMLYFFVALIAILSLFVLVSVVLGSLA